MFKENTPDLTFTVIDSSSKKLNFRSFSYSGGDSLPKRTADGGYYWSNRLKANGSIWTPLEINGLMSDSLDIIAPTDKCIRVPAGSSVGPCGDYGVIPHRGSNFMPYHPSGVWFSPDFPEFLLPKEMQQNSPPQVPANAITWGVVRMEPGTVSGPPFRGTQEIQPRQREAIAVFGDNVKKYISDSNGIRISRGGKLLHYVKLYGQHYDTLIQYNIWSKSNYEVELLTHWFLDYLQKFRGMFREAGILNMHLWNRVRDDTMVQMKNGYHVRSVLYYFRTEEVTIDMAGPINKINLNIDVDTLLPSERFNEEYLSPAESQKRILDKWIKYT